MRSLGSYHASRHARFAVLALAVAALVGCRKSDRARGDTTGAMAGMAPGDTGSRSAGASGAGSAGAASTARMSDANILAMIGIANANEIGTSKLAEQKATNANVKSFARQMVTDHTALQGDADKLAKRLNITPAPPTGAGDEAKQAAMAVSDSLKAAARGAGFDALYVSRQVVSHQRTLDDLQRFQTATGNADVKQLITTAIPKVQAHLQRAQQLQTQLGTRS